MFSRVRQPAGEVNQMPDRKSLKILQHNLPRLLEQSERMGRPVLTLLIEQAYKHIAQASKDKTKKRDASQPS